MHSNTRGQGHTGTLVLSGPGLHRLKSCGRIKDQTLNSLERRKQQRQSRKNRQTWFKSQSGFVLGLWGGEKGGRGWWSIRRKSWVINLSGAQRPEGGADDTERLAAAAEETLGASSIQCRSVR